MFNPEHYKQIPKNPTLILWFIAYFLLSWWTQNFTAKGFIITAIAYIIIITISQTNIIETIVKHIEDVRKPATKKETERLIPLYEEVYQKAKKQTPDISKNINLYIIDEIAINALALGENTIAITRGLIETMNDQEIKGILAHEIGHIANGDPKTQTLVSIGSSIYIWAFILTKYIIKKIEQTAKATESQNSLAGIFIAIIKWSIDFAIKTTMLITTILLMAQTRKNEYKADEYAAKLGYCYELKQALYTLYDLQISDKKNLIERIKTSHPRIAYRIGKLEELEETYQDNE